ncbi:Golgi-associated plant pathogenesis-related protein 1-like [Porites lutea]|uniref:Golgi-associated plant pathogenesis-related protein 1-like n=1 Tax=Porites lutea TaxID=51062 RepID=UPI003CC62ED3
MMDHCYASCGLCTMPPTPPPQVDATDCLKAHNNRRALHGTPALVWNNSLTQHAQEWAEYLLSNGSLVHASGIDEGENLAWGYGPTFRTCVQAMEGWYDDEEPQYDYDNPGFSKATGHFTQVVWQSTKSVGVALTTKKTNYGYETFIVARYYPAGNVRGQFAQNVPKEI